MRGPKSVVLVAGLTLPTGTFDDVAGTGWHGMGAIGFQAADFPVGFGSMGCTVASGSMRRTSTRTGR